MRALLLNELSLNMNVGLKVFFCCYSKISKSSMSATPDFLYFISTRSNDVKNKEQDLLSILLVEGQTRHTLNDRVNNC